MELVRVLNSLSTIGNWAAWPPVVALIAAIVSATLVPNVVGLLP